MTNRHYRHPRLFSIPPAAPFLSTLVESLLNGTLVPQFQSTNDPLALASVTIYVPTRRAVRSLQAAFVAKLAPNAVMLPRILPLGDIDEEQSYFEPSSFGEPNLDPVIGALERQLLLTQMIGQWNQSIKGAISTPPDSPANTPSTSDAAWMAIDLAGLMDSVATEEADWSMLDQLVPQELANWWQLTLQFLKIATDYWPKILAERGAMDQAVKRSALLQRQALIYRERGATGPVIAAGSTGSIPATAALLGAIARLENGAVVLPGLDRDMPDAVWQNLELPADGGPLSFGRNTHRQAASPGHSQYGLKKLLEKIGAMRSDVFHIGGIENSSSGFARIRETIVSLALEPSDATDNWPQFRDRLSDEKSARAFSDVALIEAPGERQEAVAIALAMRQTLNHQSRTAALVTPDRKLARLVSAELKRFGVNVDDSAGMPLIETRQGSLIRLMLAVALGQGDNTTFLSLLKHPLGRFGLARAHVRQAIVTIELGLFRGRIGNCDSLGNAVKRARDELENSRHIASAVQRLSGDDWNAARMLADAVDRSLAPLRQLANAGRALPLAELVQCTIETLEEVAADPEKGTAKLYDGEAGAGLSSLLTELITGVGHKSVNINCRAADWLSLFEALAGSRAVRRQGDVHPRLHIWGPLEARLQHVDRIILGGLNEGTWPAARGNDPFLNRPMKRALALEPPERRIGLAAHDFQMALGNKNVLLTRARRVENAPTVASRWLQRLLTLAGNKAADGMAARGRQYLDWAGAIDLQHDKLPASPALRPRPCPAIELRPKGLSITEIETWIRDPYAIYARHVLKLEPLEPVDIRAGARERGILYHNILEEFTAGKPVPFDDRALAHLTAIGREHFRRSGLPDDIAALWWPRFIDIAASFVAWEGQRQELIKTTSVEQSASIQLSGNFVLRGRADRIDQLKNGGLAIIDYKTGGGPSIAQANSLLAPQLPLEGALALVGGFSGLSTARIEELIYVRLLPGSRFAAERLGPTKNRKDVPDPQELSLQSWQALKALVAIYEDRAQGYLSRARPFRQGDYSGDYDHLARVREWSVGDEQADEAR